MPSTVAAGPDLVFADRATRTETLDRLQLGQSGRILAVTGDLAVRRRLLEMGLCPDVDVTAVRRAPLGDPVEYLVRGYHLSLRCDQAAQVLVAPR
ncbi:MAG: ferrous iron transport protein A [Planctomycetes bacterium]|nr:ferrous iron transport protein A [Planctomycetota bacterium]